MAIDPPAADAADPFPAQSNADSTPERAGQPAPHGDDEEPGDEPGNVGGKHYEPL